MASQFMHRSSRMCKVFSPTINTRVRRVSNTSLEVVDWKNVPRGFWQDRDNKVKFFKWLEERLHVKSPEDWYKLQNGDIEKVSGINSFYDSFGASLPSVLSSIYPSIKWQQWRFINAGMHFWDKKENQLAFLKSMEEALRIEKPEDWYNIKTSDLTKQIGATSFLNKYGGSMQRALATLYPNIEWMPWLFTSVPAGYWDDPQHQKNFIQWLSKELKIKNMSDWYAVKRETICSKGGLGFLRKMGNSIPTMLQKVFPEHNWQPWLFESSKGKFWESNDRQKEYLQWLEKDLKISTKDQWYHVKISDVEKRGGSTFLSRYGGSLHNALSSLYPEHSWKKWLFETQSKNLFSNKEIDLHDLLRWLESKLAISKPEQWHEVAQEHLIHFIGRGIVANGFNTLIDNLLSVSYPNIKWLEENFIAVNLKTQRLLYRILKSLLPKEDIKFDYTHDTLQFPDTKQNLTLDIFIPSLHVAIEYQGEHHFHNSRLYGSVANQKLRDQQKKEICSKAGITLIDIGYWWDLEKSSIQATLHKYRPDLFPDRGNGVPVPEEPPEDTELTREIAKQESDELLSPAQRESWNKFSTITGVHHSFIKQWIDLGYRSLDDLKVPKVFDSLAPLVKLGLKFHEDFSQTIPRQQVQKIEETIIQGMNSIDSTVQVVACGDYRRGNPTSGEITILMTVPRGFPGKLHEVLTSLVSKLSPSYIVAGEYKSDQHFIGAFRYPGVPTHRKVEFRIVPRNEWACALLYFTGTAHFNYSLRKLAKQKGYRLSQSNLIRYDGKYMDVDSEQDVFALLDMKYKHPWHWNT